MSFRYKQVNDPVHGTIHLSKVEVDVISTEVFQRLHNIKQLGLGVLVYPGANYSRFSHSLGACHLAGKMYDSVARNSQRICNEKEKQIYRLCGLLHDIGHYPFSHTFEHVGKTVYSNGVQAEDKVEGFFEDHEKIGTHIMENSIELKNVFDKHEINMGNFFGAFSALVPDTLTAIISSDLDLSLIHI